jgi:hypothetical protein
VDSEKIQAAHGALGASQGNVGETPRRAAAPRTTKRNTTMTNDDTIQLACWYCSAVNASPKDKPRCPTCGWTPTRLMRTSDGSWADPTAVIIGGRRATAEDATWRSDEVEA